MPYRTYLVKKWESVLRTDLVGIGFEEDGHGELWVATDERCFGLGLSHEAFYFHANSVSELLQMDELGVRSRPMILSDGEHASLYSINFQRGDSRVYDDYLPSKSE